MNYCKLIICVVIFVIFVLLIKNLLKYRICENYEELNVITKTNDSIIKYMLDIDDKMNKLLNDVNDKLIKAQDDNVKFINNVGMSWIEYKPDNYIKCWKILGNGQFIDGIDPNFNNKYYVLSYMYIIQGKNLKIKFNYGIDNSDRDGCKEGDGVYYVNLPKINSIQLIADKSLAKFSSDNLLKRNGFDYLNSTIRGFGVFQNSETPYLLDCFMFDNKKIMFHILSRNDNGGVVHNGWGGLTTIFLLSFEIEIPIV